MKSAFQCVSTRQQISRVSVHGGGAVLKGADKREKEIKEG